MENYQYNSSYPDSVNSSPRSREVDPENSSWDESFSSSSSNYKVKFLCSYGGKIQPRPHDNQLTYVGGDTKILAVDRSTKYAGFVLKLSSICDTTDVCFKYQLPGEDLDALISVTNDEDLEHMMLEYDRLHRSTAKPARLRLFIFPLINNPPSASSFGSDDSKVERQWFVDALNSVQINQNLESSPPSGAPVVEEGTTNPDFLFGLEKSRAQPPKLMDNSPPMPPAIMVGKEFHGGSEERHVIGETAIPPAPAVEIQRQIQELQRMQISGHEQTAVYNRKLDDYYQQQAHPPPPPPQQMLPPMPNPVAYWPERQEAYPAGPNEQSMYLIQTPAGVYQAPAVRPVTGGQVGQTYYGVQRMPPEVYREQQMYGAVVPPPASSSSIIQQPKIGGVYTSEGIGLVRPPAPAAPERGYSQVGFDGAGRPLYYAAPGGLMQAPPPPHPSYQAVGGTVVDARQGGGALNPDGKIIVKTSQSS